MTSFLEEDTKLIETQKRNIMKYTLFIDDERIPAQTEAGNIIIIARSSYAAIQVVQQLGMPSKICFDHDLGEEDTSIVFLNWLIEYVIDIDHRQQIVYDVHSQNPVGEKNIRSKIDQLNRYINTIVK